MPPRKTVCKKPVSKAGSRSPLPLPSVTQQPSDESRGSVTTPNWMRPVAGAGGPIGIMPGRNAVKDDDGDNDEA